VLVPLTLVPCAIGLSGIVYGAGALILGGLFLALAVAVWRDRTMASVKRLFPFSILYLFLVFALLLIDHYVAPGLGGTELIG